MKFIKIICNHLSIYRFDYIYKTKENVFYFRKKYGIEFLDAILGSNDHIKEKSE
jgi:hypothetical protein